MRVKMLEDVFIEIDGRWKTFKKGVSYELYRGIAEKFYDKCIRTRTGPNELDNGTGNWTPEPLQEG